MRVEIQQGDILDHPADVLVCSANIYLNLSGGVGGEILRRHGTAMQTALHRHLADRGLRFVQQGDVVETEGFGTGFKHVLHAVAVDGWYHSSADIIANLVSRALDRAAKLGARTVALVALGTGYGRLTMEDFGRGLHRALARSDPPIESLRVVVRTDDQVATIKSILGS
jgi:O-acetyl-ADP-ribose deacetylase (regulator of RNase III)